MNRANSGPVHSVFFVGTRTRSSAMRNTMKRKYRSEKEIYALLGSFEEATISREEWKHAEHLVVALCYLETNDLAEATVKMRNGILNLLKGFGVDLKKEMPYHETITVFWMRTAYAYSLMQSDLTLVEKTNGLCELFDKDHPLKFYSRDLLFSDRARAEFVEPDLRQFD
jgi:hypothetical protein